ncbi:hypothetical protein GCK32_005419 [Trichostrongylus colubriformis]|uniref:Uncharacterized protein n=1 Tax=Trichostrongylus colubriformis TaxID=6319 RepID=A0AAN8EX68_TRICO
MIIGDDLYDITTEERDTTALPALLPTRLDARVVAVGFDATDLTGIVKENGVAVSVPYDFTSQDVQNVVNAVLMSSVSSTTTLPSTVITTLTSSTTQGSSTVTSTTAMPSSTTSPMPSSTTTVVASTTAGSTSTTAVPSTTTPTTSTTTVSTSTSNPSTTITSTALTPTTTSSPSTTTSQEKYFIGNTSRSIFESPAQFSAGLSVYGYVDEPFPNAGLNDMKTSYQQFSNLLTSKMIIKEDDYDLTTDDAINSLNSSPRINGGIDGINCVIFFSAQRDTTALPALLPALLDARIVAVGFDATDLSGIVKENGKAVSVPYDFTAQDVQNVVDAVLS